MSKWFSLKMDITHTFLHVNHLTNWFVWLRNLYHVWRYSNRIKLVAWYKIIGALYLEIQEIYHQQNDQILVYYRLHVSYQIQKWFVYNSSINVLCDVLQCLDICEVVSLQVIRIFSSRGEIQWQMSFGMRFIWSN